MTTDKLGSAEYPADDVDLRTGVDVTKPETLKEAVQGETLDPRPQTLNKVVEGVVGLKPRP